jgi:mono/diheme cytochrome c family protein
MIGLGIVGLTYIPQALKLLIVEANPTSFYVSPTGYSARSIVDGKALFLTHCAGCHGTDARGVVPTSEDAKMPPDLTGEHSRGHRDGDLFWWISQGIVDGMPGFAEALDEPARWSLIDFIHANADAAHVKSFGADDPLRSVPVPEFSCQQPDGATISTADLRARFVLVSFVGPDSMERVRQLAAADLGPDVTKILVPLEVDLPRDSGLCVALAPEVAEAFALYREGALRGTELIIDAAGLLRAWGRPAADPTWGDPEKLAQRVAAIRQKPALPGRTTPHVHAH